MIAVVAYPVLSAPDRDWIDAIRAEHDPQAGHIGAHFTLAFPTKTDAIVLALEVRAVARTHSPFLFAIQRVIAVRDTRSDGGHVFLVPGVGAGQIDALHNALYRGALRSERREDVPFVPHITIAANRDFGWCERFAAETAVTLPAIAGHVAQLEIVETAADRVVTAGEFMLTGAAVSLHGGHSSIS